MANKPVPHPDHARKVAFLAAFAVNGTVSKSAKDAEICRRSHYDWLQNDEAYARDFAIAKQDFIESLELEADRRARDGVEEPVFQNGVKVGTKLKYSDTLLIFRLKALDPEKYRERYEQTHVGDPARPVEYHVHLDSLHNELLTDPGFLEYQRKLAIEADAGDVCENGEPRAMEDGEASGGNR